MSSKLDYLRKHYMTSEADKPKKRRKKRKAEGLGKSRSAAASNVVIHDNDVGWEEIAPDPAKINKAWEDEEAEEEKPTVVNAEEIGLRPDDDGSSPRNIPAKGMWTSVGGDTDMSPPRRSRGSVKGDTISKDKDLSPPRRRSGAAVAGGEDLSPPRRRRNQRKSPSPSRGAERPDASPPRRRRPRHASSDSDSDRSPPRRRRRFDTPERSVSPGRSPPRREVAGRNEVPRSSSPPRRADRSRSFTERRRRRHDTPERGEESDGQPRRRARLDSPDNGRESDLSPRRRPKGGKQDNKGDARRARVRSNERRNEVSTVDNTQTSKAVSAGLHSGRHFGERQERIQQERRERVAKIGEEELGKGQETVFRDRRGRKLDMLQEMMRQQEILDGKRKREEKEQFEWGTGKVQKDQAAEKMQEFEDLKNEPFARYAGDSKLEAMLKSRTRDGDPMAAFLSKMDRVDGKPPKKLYRGPPAPENRFGISPGYRWDGIVRGIGWEAKVIATMNKKTAKKESSYLWSVQDM